MFPKRPPKAPLAVEALESRLTPAATDFIQNLYQDVLHRSASAADTSYWTGKMQTDGTAAVVNAVVNSHESHADQVADVYQEVLDRPADSAGLAYWASKMDSGETADQVSAEVLSSQEYQSQHADDTSFVQGFYEDVLQRTADQAGQSYCQDQLASGITRDQVIEDFLNSDENAAQDVSQCYQDVLNRTASAVDTSYWVAQMKSGQTQDQVLQDFLLSSENLHNCGLTQDSSGSDTGSTDGTDSGSTTTGTDQGSDTSGSSTGSSPAAGTSGTDPSQLGIGPKPGNHLGGFHH